MDTTTQERPASTQTASTASQAPPAHVQLIQMATAGWVSRVVHAAAKLDIADHLAAGPRSAEDLAGALGAHAPSLHRFMRCLASLGVLTEHAGNRFALTALGEAMRTGAPGSARASILTLASPWFSGAFNDILYSISTGKTAFEKAQGMPVFEYLSKHPDEASLFSETMIGVHGREPPAVAEAYDFSTFGTIVDVGGATGNLLAAILARHEGPRGILFDRPYVVGEAPALLETQGVAGRVTIEAGDFFEKVPAGADAYVLSHIIHDWGEDQCLAILGHVREAMRPDGKLLLVEMVLPAGDAPHLGKMLDMVMLVLPGGQERTEDEYRPLLAKAGFRLTRVIPTNSDVSIVEAVQA
jgi:O-methyltransferase domain/Dimerisation domain